MPKDWKQLPESEFPSPEIGKSPYFSTRSSSNLSLFFTHQRLASSHVLNSSEKTNPIIPKKWRVFANQDISYLYLSPFLVDITDI